MGVSRHRRWSVAAVLLVAAALLSACTPQASTVLPSDAGATSAPPAPTQVRSTAPSTASLPATAVPATAVPATEVPTAIPESTASAATGGGQGRLPGEPDPDLTPGAIDPKVTQANIGSTICVAGYSARVRPPSSYTTGLKRKQIDQYGYSDHALADYEEDHLISLELGGAPRDPKNLWPEPYKVALSDGRPVGARVKDKIENRLHVLVCSGRISLADAQHEIATEWISAWFALDGESPPP